VSDADLPTSRIDRKAFLHGLLFVAFIYVSLLTMFWLKGPEAIAIMEEQLASQTIAITRQQEEAETPAQPTPLEPVETVVDLDQPVMRPDGSLAIAPMDGMYEQAELGRLPQVRPMDKLTPFNAYKRPFTVPQGSPIIALIVRDFGLSDAVSQKALAALPAEVTMLLSPYSLEPERWASASRQGGHEVWLDVKFENADYPISDPGPQAILAGSNLRYNQDKMNWNLTRATGYAGISGQTDYVFDSASAILQPLAKSVYQRGLGYLELNPKASGAIETVASAVNGPYIRADVWINDQDSDLEGSPLKELERLAKERGYAVGVLMPYEQNIDQIKTWLASLSAKGYTLAPVSAVAEAQARKAAAPVAEPVVEPAAHE
jgi:polysaccharide deacetylase 2 family uncharacterized protein YibQ